MSSYPVAAYRSNGDAGRAAGTGYQSPGTYNPNQYQPPATPANDNAPRPANDNNPSYSRENSFAKGMLGALGRAFSRRLPYLGFALNLLDLWLMLRAHQNAFYSFPGYHFDRNCTQDPRFSSPEVVARGGGSCGFAAAPLTPVDYSNPPINITVYWTKLPSQPGLAFQSKTIFTRNTPYNGANQPGGLTPEKAPLNVPYTDMPFVDQDPLPYPGIDPEQLPVDQPVATPEPIPYRVIPHLRNNQYRVPGFRPERGPDASPNPNPWKRPERWARPRPRTRPGTIQDTPPQDQEVPRVVIAPEGIASAPGFHLRRPPSSGVKEKKFILALAPGTLKRVIEEVSEFKDAMEAFWDALPRRYQTRVKGKQTSGTQKMIDLYKHADKIDPLKAIRNLAVESAKDLAYGMAGRKIAALNRELGLSGGLQLGPSAPRAPLKVN